MVRRPQDPRAGRSHLFPGLAPGWYTGGVTAGPAQRVGGLMSRSRGLGLVAAADILVGFPDIRRSVVPTQPRRPLPGLRPRSGGADEFELLYIKLMRATVRMPA